MPSLLLVCVVRPLSQVELLHIIPNTSSFSCSMHVSHGSMHSRQPPTARLLLTGPNSWQIIYTQQMLRYCNDVKFALCSLYFLQTASCCNTPPPWDKFATTAAAPEGAIRNVEWALSVIFVPAPTTHIRARGADMVRIVNPPTLHVTLNTRKNVSMPSTPATRAHTHLRTQSVAEKLYITRVPEVWWHKCTWLQIRHISR